MQDPILITWVRWHYTDGLRRCLGVAFNFIEFGLHLFSVRDLARTIFAPWKGIEWTPATKAWFSAEQLEAAWGNIISRVLGAIVRVIVIVLGFVLTLWIGLWMAGLLIVWLAAPFVVAALFIFGFRLFF